MSEVMAQIEPGKKVIPLGQRNPNIAEDGRATRIKPGEVRNPTGRPKNVGVSTLEWQTIMSTWSIREITEMADGKGVSKADRKKGIKGPPWAQVFAARSMLRGSSTAVTRAGVPVAQTEWNNILDRHIGKPVERSIMDVSTTSIQAVITPTDHAAFAQLLLAVAGGAGDAPALPQCEKQLDPTASPLLESGGQLPTSVNVRQQS